MYKIKFLVEYLTYQDLNLAIRILNVKEPSRTQWHTLLGIHRC